MNRNVASAMTVRDTFAKRPCFIWPPSVLLLQYVDTSDHVAFPVTAEEGDGGVYSVRVLSISNNMSLNNISDNVLLIKSFY